MPLKKRLPIAQYQCWLGGLLLCGLCSTSFAADEWEQVGSSNQYAIFMSAQRFKPVKATTYDSKPVKVEAWSKWIIVSDLVKDGRTIGDYNLSLSQYDCTNDTLKLITTTSYKKSGAHQQTYSPPSYSEPSRVVPDTIGEAQLKIACMVLEKINRGESLASLINQTSKTESSEPELTEAQKETLLGLKYLNATDGYPQDDEKAAYWLKTAAEKGEMYAQGFYGFLYANGRGVPQDDEQAVYWYRKSANQGYDIAQWRLGMAFKSGKGTFQDDQKAAMWFKKAAEQGNATAQFLLGIAYLKGEGVSQDIQQSVVWLQKAANQGDATAQMSLGVAYEYGAGVSQSNQQAIKWYKKAIASDDKVAREKAQEQLDDLLAKEKASQPKKSYQPKIAKPHSVAPMPTYVAPSPSIPAPPKKTKKLVHPNQTL